MGTTIWELDFYSRPILDEHQKKKWEVLVCESSLDVLRPGDSLFRYAQFCSNTEVNSVWLRTALEAAIAQAPSPPDKIRFFRRPMKNMITKACQELGIPAQPSRRTFALHQWLQQRHQDFYPDQPGFRPSPIPTVSFNAIVPKALPDALMGQKWMFVTLESSAFEEMSEWDMGFSEAFSLEIAGLTPQTRIPGVIIFSPRALPLAGWLSGTEMAFLRVDTGPPSGLILETGDSDCWRLVDLTTPAIQAEAKDFETAKQQANQVHFLAVQSDPQSESFAGFWLLQELELA
ncbi:MAG: DUF1092 family protein [Cyanothece sp. SIO1E1]|nr:DUF1092 family protein [Cyanothece sp. SIO1E1]